ncbi:hypothetical protein Tco_0252272 [Tanacetum coccineum]
MADVNALVEQAPAVAPPTRTDEQILPRIIWVPIGKSNFYLDAEKSQSNPVYKIAVDILKHTNFFRATNRGYKCQLDEQWFNLTKDTLRDALQITPVNNNKAFSSPPTQDTLINFVNDLGYPKEVKHLSNVITNDMFQPWRALTAIINLCLMGKTSGFERPRAPVLQILCGIINRAHIDYAERMWEEFTQSIHTFTEDKKNLAQHTQGKKKATLFVIPSVRFTKLIIFHLQCKYKFHPRPESPLHLPTEEPILGYLKFSAKGTKREVFGMPIPNEIITDDIRGADYYDAYLEKVTKQAKPVAPKAATKKPQPTPTKPKEKKRKQAKETTKATPPAKRAKAGKVAKKRTLKRSQYLKDAHEVEGKGKEKVGAEQAAQVLLNLQTPKKKSQAEQYIFQRRTSAPTEPSCHDESLSLSVELGLTESDTESDKEMPPVVKRESQPLSTPGVHAGPNLEHTDAEATDATTKDFSFGDQFFNDKPLEADNEKTTADTEAELMVSVTIHQDTSVIPPITSPMIDLVSRPDSPNVHQPLLTTTTATATTTTTIMTTIPLPPQLQQVSSDSILINRLGELEQHIADLVDANQALEERLDKHGSRLYRLENQDIPNQERFQRPAEADMIEILHKLNCGIPKSYQTHEDHMTLHEALEKSMARDNRDQLLSDLAEARKRRKRGQGLTLKHNWLSTSLPPLLSTTVPLELQGAFGASGSSQSPPPPPPPSNNQGGQSTSTAAPSSSKTAASTEYTACRDSYDLTQP